MPEPSTPIEIPNRALFKATEVCDLVKVQPYVLRTWEAEFPDLGVSKAAGGPRVYRRADVEQVARIKHLLLVEGLTLAGARRKLDEETMPVGADVPVIDELIGQNARRAADRREARAAIHPRTPGGQRQPAGLSAVPAHAPSTTTSIGRRKERQTGPRKGRALRTTAAPLVTPQAFGIESRAGAGALGPRSLKPGARSLS